MHMKLIYRLIGSSVVFVGAMLAHACDSKPQFNGAGTPNDGKDGGVPQNTAPESTGGSYGSAPDSNDSDASPGNGTTATSKAEAQAAERAVSNLPGVRAERVGINFEDSTDFDFNDAVLCFTGLLKIDSSNIISLKDQTVKATTYSGSACTHRIDGRIIHTDGTETPFSYNSRQTGMVPLEFRLGSRLEVTMTPLTAQCTKASTQHDTVYARVQINVCNLTGN
jgi:hypothetical protein